MPYTGILKYKIGVYRTESNGAALASVFPKDEASVVLKKKMLTTFEVDGFNAETIEHYLHSDYGEKRTGLKEGFHFVRGRAFLSRLGEASIYNTFSRTFYYDVKQNRLVFPIEKDNVVVNATGRSLKGEKPKPGSYRGRVNNEPEDGRKTLMDLKNA